MALCTEDSRAWEEQYVCIPQFYTGSCGCKEKPLEGLIEHYAMCWFPLFLLREGLMSVAL